MKLTFGATLPTGVTKDDTDETTVSIADDDAPAGAVTLVLSHTTIAESGTGNSSTVTASLASASSVQTTVTVSVDPGRHAPC